MSSFARDLMALIKMLHHNAYIQLGFKTKSVFCCNPTSQAAKQGYVLAYLLLINDMAL